MKWTGAMLIVGAFGYYGWKQAADYRREERILRQILRTLEWVCNELACRMWPLPVLFRHGAETMEGELRSILLELAGEMEQFTAADAYQCMICVLDHHSDLPENCKSILLKFGSSLGKFDLSGQLKEIMHIQEDVRAVLAEFAANRDEKLRCRWTLSLCAGIALAIVLL